MTTDPRDAALQSACPTLAAPRFGALPGMLNGQRIVVAANGVYLQVKLDWLDCTLLLSGMPAVPPLPYGRLEERIQFTFGVIPLRLLEAFIEAGRAGLPHEIAGGLIYSCRTGELRLQIYEALSATSDRIRYRMPELEADETIAVDLHTHGRLPAFFSPIDDRDDQGIKVAGVFGELHSDTPSAAFRLAVNGYYRVIPNPWRAAQVANGLETSSPWSILNWLRSIRDAKWNI